MTTETFRRADHRPVPTSDDEAEASCYFPLDIAHSPSRRRLSKEIVGRETVSVRRAGSVLQHGQVARNLCSDSSHDFDKGFAPFKRQHDCRELRFHPGEQDSTTRVPQSEPHDRGTGLQ